MKLGGGKDGGHFWVFWGITIIQKNLDFWDIIVSGIAKNNINPTLYDISKSLGIFFSLGKYGNPWDWGSLKNHQPHEYTLYRACVYWVHPLASKKNPQKNHHREFGKTCPKNQGSLSENTHFGGI